MKNGKTVPKVDVVLCDETCMSFNLTMWDNNVLLAESWTPMDTVLFAADVRIMYNDYKSAMTASTDSKTILTINPDIPEAACMRDYSKTQVSFLTYDNEDIIAANEKDPPLDTITNILSVRDVRNLLENASETSYGLMYPFLSHFDIDNEEKLFCREVCSKCHKFVQESNGFVCGNPNCSGGDLRLGGPPDVEYSLTVGLSDHTGTVEHCFVSPNIAEQLLGVKANEFREMSGQQKTDIKWSLLLERVKTVVKIRGKCNGKQRPSVKILSLAKPTTEDLVLTGLE
ncbi:meiosis-specific with OB domain-containing protein [Elysia marginata]|uniref:Meiosis-specific with OB domain-containing protein n=1 Tax=Elysia marginata TaxID=1093978 RepID=A0AAV4G6Q6_9GAST|nr:meiosis-specific with OB domain-containing protein [Elysia marginata]